MHAHATIDKPPRLYSVSSMSSKRTPEQLAKRAEWFRNYYRNCSAPRLARLKSTASSRQMLSAAEAAAIRFPSLLDEHIKRWDDRNISAAWCRKCGNNRVWNPDVCGRCRRCTSRKRARHRSRRKAALIASGRWGTIKRLAKQRRRARLRANGGTFSDLEWKVMLSYYGNRCVCCGTDGPLEPDHVIPLVLGGPHSACNIQPLCHHCNSIKGTTPMDYRPDRPLHHGSAWKLP